ncbi:MAG: TetR/AcrR family transcriptional regulator [Nocardioidaceae bacterium]
MTVKKGRPRSFDRDVALEKAMLLFWERGYEAAPIRDLTHAMGITTPSLYAAFTDKQTLFCGGCRYLLASVRQLHPRDHRN